MCEEMELEDEEAKDFIQRQRSQWKELARLPDRIDIVLDKMLKHFLEHPDPNGFKAQLVAVDRDGMRPLQGGARRQVEGAGVASEWSDVIISEGQNDEPELQQAPLRQAETGRTDRLFQAHARRVERGTATVRRRQSKWRPPLKILIVCDRLLTGFDAPVEQVMYLDKPLRDHNLLQAIARTNRPLPAMKKRTGSGRRLLRRVQNLEKALNFDENIREESLIDWEALKATVPGEVARCMEIFKGITIADTRDCLLAALRRS